MNRVNKMFLAVTAIICLIFIAYVWLRPGKKSESSAVETTTVGGTTMTTDSSSSMMSDSTMATDSSATMAGDGGEEEIDIKQFDNLVRGKLSYNIPDTMDVGKQYIAKVSVTKALSEVVLLYGFSKKEIKKTIIVDSIAISSRVEVSLIDPLEENFFIKSVNKSLQTVDTKSNTVWKWYVKPNKVGKNPLELVVSTRVADHFGSDYRDIPVFSKTINVKSNYWYSTKSFFSKNWQYIFSSVLIPLAIWIYTLITKKQDEIEKK